MADSPLAFTALDEHGRDKPVLTLESPLNLGQLATQVLDIKQFAW